MSKWVRQKSDMAKVPTSLRLQLGSILPQYDKGYGKLTSQIPGKDLYEK